MQNYLYLYQAANDASNSAITTADHDVSLRDKYSAIQLPLFPQDNRYKKYTLFQELIWLNLEKEQQKCKNQEITQQTLEMLRCRLNGHLLAYFGVEDVRAINHRKIFAFITYLQNEKVGAVTINQYLGLLKRVLYLGILEGLLEQMPIFPKLKSKSIPRGSFSLPEYKRLLRISKKLSSIEKVERPPTHRNTAGGAFIKYDGVPVEMRWLIGFMVNTFIRPVDIKLIKNKHIHIVDGANRYLRIQMIETKKHTGQIISMRVAVSLYLKILAFQKNRGYGGPDDYLFFPEVKDRQGAIALISGHFKKILDKGNMAIGVNNEKRSLYSLRHTAITFRLLYGRGIDLLTLARNARTSVEMIERFYASNLTAEMNVDMLQSKRTSISGNKFLKNDG